MGCVLFRTLLWFFCGRIKVSGTFVRRRGANGLRSRLIGQPLRAAHGVPVKRFLTADKKVPDTFLSIFLSLMN